MRAAGVLVAGVLAACAPVPPAVTGDPPVYCTGQRVTDDAGVLRYPNGQPVADALGQESYPNGVRLVGDQGEIRWANGARVRNATGDHLYPNGRQVLSSFGDVRYPNGQRPRVGPICFYENGERLEPCPAFIEIRDLLPEGEVVFYRLLPTTGRLDLRQVRYEFPAPGAIITLTSDLVAGRIDRASIGANCRARGRR